MPNKFFEYLVSGLPIISTADSEISEFVEENEIGLVFSYHNIEILERQLFELDPAKYYNMKLNVAKIVQDLGFKKQSEKIIKLYASLD